VQLVLRVGGEVVEALEGLRQLAQRVDVELGVVLHPALGLRALDLVLEAHALDAQHDVAVHLHEAAVAVPGEARVARPLGEPLHRCVVEPQVQDGVHHPRHRVARPRAHRHQQRVVVVAQALAGLLLQPRQRLGDLLLQSLRERLPGVHVGDTGLGGDGEAARHEVGPQHARHLRDVRALAAQEVAHLARSLGEVVNPLCGDRRAHRAHPIRRSRRANERARGTRPAR
jgi:hypothetical protein